MPIITVTDNTFEQEVLKASFPTLVFFWAEWNSASNAMLSALPRISADYSDMLKIVTLNIDNNQLTASRFFISEVPTIMLFTDGNVAASKIGAFSKSQLESFLDSLRLTRP